MSAKLKGYFFCNKTISSIYKKKTQTKPLVKILINRASTISNNFVNIISGIESGRGLIRILNRPTSAGFKAGEFAFTRKPFVFPKKKHKKTRR